LEDREKQELKEVGHAAFYDGVYSLRFSFTTPAEPPSMLIFQQY